MLRGFSSAFSTRRSLPGDLSQVKSQWQNPNDILSVLTIIGGDIVQRAIAQMAGSVVLNLGFIGVTRLAPVAFSFGFVAYSISVVLAFTGEGRLMPPNDVSSVLVNASNGNVRANQSWVLGRLLRDYESRHRSEERGLTVSVFKISSSHRIGMPTRDWVFFTAWAVISVQHAIAVIPIVLSGHWTVFILTTTGTLLALVHGALPQWTAEKWAARTTSVTHSHPPKVKREVVCLTRGNGSKHVLVIINGQPSLRFEDLAAAREAYSPYSRPVIAILSVLWIAHLLTIAGLNDDAWYSFAIGVIGMIQNIIAAGVHRSSGALGIHLEDELIVYKDKVLLALQSAEEVESGVGVFLLPIFFPGTLRTDEEAWRDRKLAERRRRGAKELVRDNSDDKIIQTDIMDELAVVSTPAL